MGMGKELADEFSAAKQVFEAVDEALQQRLSKIVLMVQRQINFY